MIMLKQETRKLRWVFILVTEGGLRYAPCKHIGGEPCTLDEAKKSMTRAWNAIHEDHVAELIEVESL